MTEQTPLVAPTAVAPAADEPDAAGYQPPRLTRLGTLAELTQGGGTTPFSDGVSTFFSGIP